MDRRDIADEVRRFARMLRDQAWIVLLCIAVAVLAAAIYESSKETAYQAQSKVLLVQDDPNATLQGTGFFLDPVRQRATALELITGPNVAARAARQLNRKGGLAAVHASASGDSNVVTIFAVSRDPKLSAQTADAYAKQYVEFRRDAVRARYDQALADVRDRVRRLQASQSPTSGAQLKQLGAQAQQLSLLASTRLPDATVIQRANGVAVAQKPRWSRNLLLAAIGGLLIGLALAFIRDRLDDRIKTEEDLADVLPGVPVLTAIPRWRPGQRWRREASEGYFNLGVALRSRNGSVPASTSYLITSALGEDGKSTTALNLALALGREGRNALLVDGDLRRPRVTEMLGAPKGDGFAKVLDGQSTLEDAVSRQQFHANGQKNGIRRGRKPLVTVQGDVSVLPAGRTSNAPQRLITEQTAHELLEQAREQDRFTVIDGPPLGLFGDMLPIARQVDGVVVVVKLYHSRRRALRNMLRQLDTAGLRPVGVVLIGTPTDQDNFYGY